MDNEEYRRKALEPIVNYIGSVMASYSKEELEARIKKALPEKESDDERILEAIIFRLGQLFEIWFDNIFCKQFTKAQILAYLEKQKERVPLSKDEEYTLARIIEYLEDNDCPSEWKDLLHDVYSLPYQKEQKPVEWSKEDDYRIRWIISLLTTMREKGVDDRFGDSVFDDIPDMIAWFKSLRPQPKEEREPMEIKYGGKIYQVHGVRSLPGGATGYIIEDEPGHYDCIINPDEVLGGGYGIKGCGSSYPTKEVNLGQPHWKPSKKQINALNSIILIGSFTYVGQTQDLISLKDDLKKLM